jgi:carboxypeptidase family protein/TonB-dependent receptor-like protein
MYSSAVDAGRPGMAHPTFAFLTAFLCLAPQPGTAFQSSATLTGLTTTQKHSVILPGVEVTIVNIDARGEATVVVSDGAGHFRVTELEAGRYRVLARLAGFSDLVMESVVLAAGHDVEAMLDLTLAPVAESVNVIGEAGTAAMQPAASRDTVSGRMVDVLPVAGDGFRSLLPVLPGVVRAADGRISLKGGHATQGALQLDQANGSDPSTGNFGIELPVDAVESVGIVANPYAAQGGRFSSSMVKIDSRSGENRWRATANSFLPLPCLKLCDGASVGFRAYNPRAWLGGPLVRDRLFVSQSIEFKLNKIRIPGVPEPNNFSEVYSYDTFTRIDTGAGGHTVSATLAVFPRDLRYVNLNTFNHDPVTANLRLRGYNAAVSDTATLTPRLVAALSFNSTLYHTGIFGQGDEAMELTPEGNRGNYFNAQDRRTRAYQLSGSLTSVPPSAWGDHLVKVGVDVLHAAYVGSSRSNPIIVRRADGTASQRFDFGGAATSQRIGGTDVAVFAEEQWRVNDRVLLEPGVRLDRDGVLGDVNVSPRLSAVVSVLPEGVSVLRGGGGVFYERTPLNVGAFGSFETASLTRFAADGVTPLDAPVAFDQVTSPLVVPRANVWNVEYDHRFGGHVFLKLNHLRRDGHDEFVVEPTQSVDSAQLRLASSGRSRYVETEATLRVGATDERLVAFTYVRSHSTANLNAFDLYFGNIRNPIIRPDQYATSPVDVPHRLVSRAVIPLWKWTLTPLVEVRSGFPYSVVDQDQEFVGIRNGGGRFPVSCTIDANLMRQVKIKGRTVNIGVRGWHLLDTFAPRDVQTNLDSPNFGRFYNTIPRKVAFVLQLAGMAGPPAR